MKYVLIFLFSVTTMISAEKDSIICFKKTEIVTLANKIQLLRDSVEYLQTIVNVQDTVIGLYVSRTDFYNQQLKNRNEVIDVCKKRSIELEKLNEELQPKWYDNKFLWFLSGIATTVGILLVAQ